MFRTCKVCGVEFKFSEGEQAFYKDRALDPPKRCPECRARKRREQKETELAKLKARVRELEEENGEVLQSPQ